jgi:hypothetical protein
MNYLPYNSNIATSTFSLNFRKYLQFKVHWHCYTDGTFTTSVNNTSGLISHEIYIDWFDLIVNLPPVSKTLLVNDTVVTSDNSIRFAAR